MMEWSILLSGIFLSVVALLSLGIPVAFTFFLINIVGAYFLQGGAGAFPQLILSIQSAVSSFSLLPIPLFVLMGEILWHSQIAFKALEALDRLLGRLPGRQSLLTVLTGTVFAALSGSTMANTAMLGSMLLPQMLKRGYAGELSMGPIMASGGLAMLIPPSALAVIFAAVAKISIGKVLLALIVPGLVLAALYAGYIVWRATRNPALAPSFSLETFTWRQKIVGVVKYLLPLTVIVFLVVGVIFVGVATPTEAAALGAVGSFALAIAYGGMSRKALVTAIRQTVYVSVMMLTIMAAAMGFSQLLAYSGVSRGLLNAVVTLSLPPLALVFGMQLVVLVLGCFMEQIAIMLITLPIFMPVILALKVDPIWFAAVTLINLELALMTPPFGLLLFVMKGVAPPHITMQAIYRAALPYIVINMLVIGLLFLLPALALWLPGLT
jgi:tripartite ATP-independent transporter DctM subunit